MDYKSCPEQRQNIGWLNGSNSIMKAQNNLNYQATYVTTKLGLNNLRHTSMRSNRITKIGTNYLWVIIFIRCYLKIYHIFLQYQMVYTHLRSSAGSTLAQLASSALAQLASSALPDGGTTICNLAIFLKTNSKFYKLTLFLFSVFFIN